MPGALVDVVHDPVAVGIRLGSDQEAEADADFLPIVAAFEVVAGRADAVEPVPFLHVGVGLARHPDRQVVGDQIFHTQFDRDVQVPIEILRVPAVDLSGSERGRNARGQEWTKCAQSHLWLQDQVGAEIGEPFGLE